MLSRCLRSSAGASVYLTGRSCPLVVPSSDPTRAASVLDGLVRAGDLNQAERAQIWAKLYPAETASYAKSV